MTLITTAVLQSTFKACLDHAKTLYRAESWRLMPCSIAISSSIKSKYATVSHDGHIAVNHAFIGTASIAKLKETLFHEIAHCIVGLEQGHNQRFRNVFSSLVSHITVTDADVNAIKDNNGYPLRLIAYTKEGPLDLGGAFRRSKKYLNYAPTKTSFLSVRGVKVERFAYLPYGDDWENNKN